MRKIFCFLICLLIATATFSACVSDDAKIGNLHGETQAKYADLSKQANAMMKETITVPVPPSTSVSCPNEAESQSLNEFQETFNAPEGPLCAQMLEMQRQLQLLGAEPSYEREAALMDRLGQKALALIKEYGQDVEKVPAIAMVAIKTAADIELLGSDQYGRSADLTKAISVMYENAIEELFAMLVDEHDYGTVHTILETARASLLLSDTSGVDTDEIINRLQKALHFELTINYYYEQTGNHRWVEQAVFDVEAVFEGSEIGNISGSGSGSMLSFIWDDEPELSVTAPDFPVQAVFTKFNPCDATVELRLTPFHPLTETLHTDGESMDWPLLKTSWEVAFTENLQEDGFYRFPLTLNNLKGTAVSETLEYSVPSNEVKMEILLVHKPQS